MKVLILMLISLGSVSLHAQQLPAPSGINGNISLVNQDRYLGVGTTKEVLQDNLTIRATVDFNGVIEIHSLVQTGNTYNSGYNNLYDFKKDAFSSLDTATQIYIKQLYFKKMMASGHLALSAGALDTGDSIALANAKSSIGWIDGVRAQLNTKEGTITVNAGKIEPKDPDAINRVDDLSLNYFEITVKRKVLENMLAEVSVENFEGKNYIEAATKYDLKLATDKILHLIGEAKLEDNGAIKASIGVQDVLSLITSSSNQIKVSMNYEYISKSYDVDMRGLSSAMHSGYTGGAFVTSVQFPISKEYGINGFTNLRLGSDPSDMRIEVGITKSIFDKSFKRKH